MPNIKLSVTIDASESCHGSISVPLSVDGAEINVHVVNVPANQEDEVSDLNATITRMQRRHDEYVEFESGYRDRCFAVERELSALRLSCDPKVAECREKLKQYMRENGTYNHISAIKYMREISALGLKEAKDIADVVKAEVLAEEAGKRLEAAL